MLYRWIFQQFLTIQMHLAPNNNDKVSKLPLNFKLTCISKRPGVPPNLSIPEVWALKVPGDSLKAPSDPELCFL